MHPDAPENCSDGFIRSHTVQRATALASIAENGHVLSGRDIRPSKHEKYQLDEISINRASTFRGFCSKHDNYAFRDSDLANNVSKRVAFLLGYRALSYELYMKIISKPTLEMYRDRMDAGAPFDDQARIQQHLAGSLYTTDLAIKEHSKTKSVWDKALSNGIPDCFKWAAFSFDAVLPIVTSGAFYPEHDFQGRRLQRLDAPIGSLSLLTFQLISIANRSYFVLAWLDGKQKNQDLLDSLLSVDRGDISSAIIKFCFDTSDNIFVKPSWWHALSPNVRYRLLLILRESTPGEKQKDGLKPFHERLSSSQLISIDQSG